jgi:osmotically-inducible protein OsmY
MITKADSQLQHEVNDELRFDPSVGGAELGVAARDGVITLSGTVSSYAIKYAAVKAAERVFGVRAVADDIVVAIPSSTKRTDTDIAHSVATLLKWNVTVPDDRVKARVQDGWVTLDGDVEWQFQKTAAEHCVRTLGGVQGVTNLIAVNNRANATDVKQHIENALKRHAEVDARHIAVEAVRGTVTLRGKVRSRAEREDVERAAWSAPGVLQVKDELRISV